MRIYLTYLVLIICVMGCKKDKNIVPTNPTNNKTTAIFNQSKIYGTMTDQDGNKYRTIQIGSQIWMAENLRVTHYSNGDEIQHVTNKSVWLNLKTGAYCNNTLTESNDSIATFGRLYNWYAVNNSLKISPAGWHVASDAEWNTLNVFLQGGIEAAIRIKEAGKTHWKSLVTQSNNESGFTALPGGMCNEGMQFNRPGYYAFWWTSTPASGPNAYYMEVSHDDIEKVSRYNNAYNLGLSVRCVKD